MCVIMSQCPLLATLIRSVSHAVMDRPTILLPQFSTSSVKSLLALLYTGKCALSQDRRSEFEEIKQILKAIGMNFGAEALEIVLEEVFTEMDVTASSNNNTSDANGNIKIEIKIEPKQEPDMNNENGGSFISSLTPRLGNDHAVAVGDTIEKTEETQGAARVEGDIDEDPWWKKEFYEDSREEEFDQIDQIDIDEDLWKEEFYEDSKEEKFDKDPRQEDIDSDVTYGELGINSFPAVLEDEKAGGRSAQKGKICLMEVRSSGRERKPVTYKGEKEIEVKHKNKFKGRLVNINRHGSICGFCGTCLNGENELVEHLGMGLGNAYRCKVKQDMEMVKMAQSGMRKHVCKECGKGFTKLSKLTYHGVVHTKRRPFSCNQCDKSYGSASVLAQHRQTVHEGVEYGCQECGKPFGTKGNRDQHYKCVHLKEKKYKKILES